MNKGDLINEVSSVLDSKKNAKEAIDAVFEAIKDALANGESVSLIGFGTFKVVDRKERTGRNPQTGEKLKIKAKRVPKFVPGTALKEAVE